MNNGIPKELKSQNRADPQNGNLKDAGAIYSQYHQSIYRYLYYRTNDPQTAEDLTGDVFLKMVQSLPVLAIGNIPFRAWLFQVARNHAIDHHRRKSIHPETPMDESFEDREPAVDTLVEFRLTSAGLAKALSTLEDSQKDVLILRFVEQMPIAHVAMVLHRSEDSIKALQRRALITLRFSLASQEADDG